MKNKNTTFGSQQEEEWRLHELRMSTESEREGKEKEKRKTKAVNQG